MKKIHPFHCGSQGGDWFTSNCDRCKKSGFDGEKHKENKCDIWTELSKAVFGYGWVSEEFAKRMGVPEDCRVYNWMCPEIEWTMDRRMEN